VHAAVQIATEMQVPVTPRGGGTSLSGQSIGPGLVIDCSKYLNRLLALDAEARTARVQPGLVLDPLNRALAPHGLQFGPDVATANRANLGGMIGNNSAGARSVVYGKTSDHVRRLGVVLADGSRAEFGPLGATEWEQKAELRSLEGAIYRRVREVVTANAGEIRRRFPRILRRVSGYNLDLLCASLTPPPTPSPPGGEGPSSPLAPWGRGVGGEGLPGAGLHQLVIGSEGTLAVVTEAELALVPRPRHRALLVPQFASL